jgi:ribonucleoside-diphosphate reductase alpha chain
MSRERLPKRRQSVVHELRLGGHKVFVEVGFYADGRPGEVWINPRKPGSDLKHFANGFAIAISLLLQWGVPLDEIVHSFEKLSGGPQGDVLGHDRIRNAKSMVHLVVQLLQDEAGRAPP